MYLPQQYKYLISHDGLHHTSHPSLRQAVLSLDHHHHCRQQQQYDEWLTGPKRRPTGCRLGLKYFFLVCFIYLYIFDLFTIRLRVSTGTTTVTTEVWMGGEEKKGPK